MRFGELLQSTRVAARVSLRDLGKAIGLSAVYISDIEGGSRKPPAPPIVLRIAGHLKADPVPMLRAAISERKTVEFGLPLDEQSKRAETVLALARKWEELDDSQWEAITNVVNRETGGEDEE